MLSSITNINVSILSLVRSGNVREMSGKYLMESRIAITASPHVLLSSDVPETHLQLANSGLRNWS